MIRDLPALSQEEYDLAVIGGGIYGAAVAWEAASRGLSVALLEKADFALATSANSMKTIHGGFRYLQHADLPRVRESIAERDTLMRIAPHLVHPLPVLAPTRSHGMKGREALALALLAYAALSIDRRRPEDPQKSIPAGRILSRSETLRLLPGLDPRDLNGAALFYDAQVYNSERMVLAFLQAAAEAGAQLANYAPVTGFLRSGDQVTGVVAVDALTGQPFEVRARQVVNTAGPWIDSLLALPGGALPGAGPLVRAMNVVTRPLFEGYAVGLLGDNGYADSGSLARKSGSLLFVTPWRGRSIAGTSYVPYSGDPDAMKATAGDVQALLDALNAAHPAGALTLQDVDFVHIGLLPAGRYAVSGRAVEVSRHYRILDHAGDGAAGLLSVVGVKYTTARDVAQRLVSRIFRMRGQEPAPSRTASTRLPGGEIERFDAFLQAEVARRPCGLGPEAVRGLVYNYGSAYPQVLAYMQAGGGDLVGNGAGLDLEMALLRAQAIYAMREEMALRLSDVILRRTDLGSAAHPGLDRLGFVARVMAAELGWSEARVQEEIESVDSLYRWEG